MAVLVGNAIFFSSETFGFSTELGMAIGKALVGYSLLSMIAAGLALYLSANNLRGFLLQAGPAALALAFVIF